MFLGLFFGVSACVCANVPVAPQVVWENKSPPSAPPRVRWWWNRAEPPTAEPEPGALQPAGATEDGGVLWARSLNSPAPDPNDIRRHVSSPLPSLALLLSLAFHFHSPSSLPPAPAFPTLSYAATICLPPPPPPLPPPPLPSPSLCLGEEVEPVWWRGERLCHTCHLMSSCSACHQLWRSQNGRHISHYWALICLVCEWLAWWLHSGLITMWGEKIREKTNKKKWKKRTKRQNRRSDVTRCLWWEIVFSCFHCGTGLGEGSVRRRWYPEGFKVRGCLMASSLSSTVCMSQYSFTGFSFSIFPTWAGDTLCQGISVPVND